MSESMRRLSGLFFFFFVRVCARSEWKPRRRVAAGRVLRVSDIRMGPFQGGGGHQRCFAEAVRPFFFFQRAERQTCCQRASVDLFLFPARTSSQTIADQTKRRRSTDHQ